MKTVCFGEIMLRLSPPEYCRFGQADSFDLFYGGAEANVAVSLAELGCESAFITRLPNHELGWAALCELRRWGVDTRFIVRSGERIGLYYFERGASHRPPKVIYDRAGSAFALSSPSDYDWETILNGAGWFNYSGITPALGDNTASICMDAIETAKRNGAIVSCDVNYRRALWSAEKAGSVMDSLLYKTDVCIVNEEHAGLLFGIKGDVAKDGDRISFDGAAIVAKKLSARFGFINTAVTIRRTISSSDNLFAAVLYNRDTDSVHYSRIYEIRIVDRVGSGDAFCAGLIRSLQKGVSYSEAVEFAAAACALKHTVQGDMNHLSENEVMALAQSFGRAER